MIAVSASVKQRHGAPDAHIGLDERLAEFPRERAAFGLSLLGFGQPAIPYLRGVDDPYEAETGSPYEHWKRKFSIARMNSAMRGLGLKGKLRNIVVTQRGTSPRIVHANLVGSGGTTTVTGPQLRTALGLADTWAFFKKKK